MDITAGQLGDQRDPMSTKTVAAETGTYVTGNIQNGFPLPCVGDGGYNRYLGATHKYEDA